MRLKDKVAVVTDAAGWIGRATARLFAANGAVVVCVDVDGPGGEETVALIRRAGGDAYQVTADVSRPDDVERMAASCVERFRRVNVLFNNAGIIRWGTLEEAAIEDWQRVLAVNLTGPFLCSKYLLRAMKAAGSASIVHNGSIDGVMGNPSVAAYSASKGGLVPLTRVMAYELAHLNIRVNCICPAGIDVTEGDPRAQGLNAATLNHFGTAEKMQSMLDRLVKATPAGRPGRTDEVANLVLFLASDEASYIAGSMIMIDGGRSAITPGTGYRH